MDFPPWTSKIFNRFEDMLGGRCRAFVTGSAPLSQKHGEFVLCLFNTHMFEGFGMSETSAHGGVQSVYSLNFGFIGESLDSNSMMKLRSIDEMNYTINDVKELEFGKNKITVCCPRGEVMVKGPAIF